MLKAGLEAAGKRIEGDGEEEEGFARGPSLGAAGGAAAMAVGRRTALSLTRSRIL
jgi:hypothetical protein